MRPQPLLVAATGAYLANCALGASVALRLIDTRGFRWVHHGLYIGTSILTAAAFAGALVAGRPATAVALAPTAIPLAAINRFSARSRRHPLIALTAAPFYAAALVTDTALSTGTAPSTDTALSTDRRP